MLLKKETWVTRFAARRWRLSTDAHADAHIERGRALYEAMQHLDPQEVAEQDFSCGAFPAAHFGPLLDVAFLDSLALAPSRR